MSPVLSMTCHLRALVSPKGVSVHMRADSLFKVYLKVSTLYPPPSLSQGPKRTLLEITFYLWSLVFKDSRRLQ